MWKGGKHTPKNTDGYWVHTAPISDERDDKAGACNRHEAEGKERKTT